MIKKDAKIFIAGHRGLVGSAILSNLKHKGYTNFVLKTHKELDLLQQSAVNLFFEKEKPEYVFLAAAKVGGIVANNVYRAEFIYENLMIQNNVIHASYVNGVKKLLFLGSTCIYPKDAPQPMSEDCLLTSPLEYTNEPYAIAKIAGIKMCESYNIQYKTNFLSVMPTNLYGPNDNFDLEKSHVLPALMRKVYLAKCLNEQGWLRIRIDLNMYPIEKVDGNSSEQDILAILKKYGVLDNTVEIWGSGKPMREFLWSEEMADASVYVMEHADNINTHINIGTGEEISIEKLSLLISKTINFTGNFIFNTDKPDGSMRKLCDVSKLHDLGWHHKIGIVEGIEKLYKWYLSNKEI